MYIFAFFMVSVPTFSAAGSIPLSGLELSPEELADDGVSTGCTLPRLEFSQKQLMPVNAIIKKINVIMRGTVMKGIRYSSAVKTTEKLSI